MPHDHAADRLVTIRELIKFRKPFYERVADIKINTTRLDINSVVAQIISKVKEDESFRLQK